MKAQAKPLDKLCWLLAVIFLVLISILTNDSYGALVLLGCAGLIFALSALQNDGILQVHIGPYHWFWGAFGLYCLASSLWAWNASEAASRGVTLLEMTACVALMYVHFQQETDMWRLYSILKWAGFLISLYTITVYGFNAIVALLASGQQLRVEFTNTNSISIQAAMAIVICLYELIFKKKRLSSLLLCIPCLIVVAASGTRKSLLVVLLGVVLLLYFRYQGRQDGRNVLRMLVWLLVAVVAVMLVLSLPAFSGMMQRMEGFQAWLTGEGEVDNSTNLRARYIQIGLEQFWKTPIFGIGINNSGILLEKNFEKYTYLHNNIVELLCCGGIVGFCLYYAMYAYCGIYLYSASRRGDTAAKLGLTILLIFTFMDIARVSYYAKPSFFYFMIFFLQVRQIQQRRQRIGT